MEMTWRYDFFVQHILLRQRSCYEEVKIRAVESASLKLEKSKNRKKSDKNRIKSDKKSGKIGKSDKKLDKIGKSEKIGKIGLDLNSDSTPLGKT